LPDIVAPIPMNIKEIAKKLEHRFLDIKTCAPKNTRYQKLSKNEAGTVY
jgi:hypothetical protein